MLTLEAVSRPPSRATLPFDITCNRDFQQALVGYTDAAVALERTRGSSREEAVRLEGAFDQAADKLVAIINAAVNGERKKSK